MDKKNIREELSKLLWEDENQGSSIRDEVLLEEDLGMDSLKRTKFICDIEEQFGFEIEIADLDPGNFKTMGDVCRLIEKYVGSNGA